MSQARKQPTDPTQLISTGTTPISVEEALSGEDSEPDKASIASNESHRGIFRSQVWRDIASRMWSRLGSTFPLTSNPQGAASHLPEVQG